MHLKYTFTEVSCVTIWYDGTALLIEEILMQIFIIVSEFENQNKLECKIARFWGLGSDRRIILAVGYKKVYLVLCIVMLGIILE